MRSKRLAATALDFMASRHRHAPPLGRVLPPRAPDLECLLYRVLPAPFIAPHLAHFCQPHLQGALFSPSSQTCVLARPPPLISSLSNILCAHVALACDTHSTPQALPSVGKVAMRDGILNTCGPTGITHVYTFDPAFSRRMSCQVVYLSVICGSDQLKRTQTFSSEGFGK